MVLAMLPPAGLHVVERRQQRRRMKSGSEASSPDSLRVEYPKGEVTASSSSNTSNCASMSYQMQGAARSPTDFGKPYRVNQKTVSRAGTVSSYAAAASVTNVGGTSTPRSDPQYSLYVLRTGTPESNVPVEDITKWIGGQMTEEPSVLDTIMAAAHPEQPRRRSILEWQFTQHSRPSMTGLFSELRRATDPETWTHQGRRFSWLHGH